MHRRRPGDHVSSCSIFHEHPAAIRALLPCSPQSRWPSARASEHKERTHCNVHVGEHLQDQTTSVFEDLLSSRGATSMLGLCELRRPELPPRDTALQGCKRRRTIMTVATMESAGFRPFQPAMKNMAMVVIMIMMIMDLE